MQPALSPGDHVLVDPFAFATRDPEVGEIVVARHPIQRQVILVKRVRETADDGSVLLESAAPSLASDSRAFGRVARNLLVGPVALHLAAGKASKAR